MKNNKMKHGFLFNVLNFISRDYLRNYLAVGVRLPLVKAKDCIEKHPSEALREIERAIKGIDDIFNL